MSRSTRQQWITHDVERTTGGTAQQATITAGKAVATAVRTTLGPAGRDKMLIGTDGTVVVTNDGASILDRMEIDDPAARLVVRAANAQNEAAGDGVTTTVLLVGELLSKAEALLNDGLHPTTILNGYDMAVAAAQRRLDEYSVDLAQGEQDRLQAVAKTAVTGRWDSDATDRFATLATTAVRAVEDDGTVDTSSLTTKAVAGGEVRDSELVEGLVIDTDTSSTTIEMPTSGYSSSLADVRLALVNDEITTESPRGIDTVSVDSPEQLDSLRAHESATKAEVVRRLGDLAVDILVCQKSIDDTIRTNLAREGILAVERTRQDEFDAVARATAATAVQSIDDLAQSSIGTAGSVERRSAGSATLLVITDLPEGSQVSLLLRGGTEHVAAETKRIVESCIAVVRSAIREGSVLPGGGATETALAMDLSRDFTSIDGREQLAANAFANALERVPRTLVENAGRDPFELLPDLRSRHEENAAVGVRASAGELGDMLAVGVLEPVGVKRRCLATAVETTAMILRIDDILQHPAQNTDDATDEDRASRTRGKRSTGGYPWAIGH